MVVFVFGNKICLGLWHPLYASQCVKKDGVRSVQWHHMSVIPSQMTGYSTVCSGVHQRNRQASAFQALCGAAMTGRFPLQRTTNGECFPCHDVIVHAGSMTVQYDPPLFIVDLSSEYSHRSGRMGLLGEETHLDFRNLQSCDNVCIPRNYVLVSRINVATLNLIFRIPREIRHGRTFRPVATIEAIILVPSHFCHLAATHENTIPVDKKSGYLISKLVAVTSLKYRSPR